MRLVSSGFETECIDYPASVSLFEVGLPDLFGQKKPDLGGDCSLSGQITSLHRVLTLDSPDNQGFTQEVRSALRRGYFIGSTLLYGGKRDSDREWVFAIDDPNYYRQVLPSNSVHYPSLEDHFLLLNCNREVSSNLKESTARKVRALRTSSFKAGDCNIEELHRISDPLKFMTGDHQAPDKVRSIMEKEALNTIYLSIPREGHVTTPIIYRDGKSLYLRPLNHNLPLGQAHALISMYHSKLFMPSFT